MDQINHQTQRFCLTVAVVGCLSLILLCRQSHGQASISVMNFFKDTLCDVDARIQNGCSKQVPGVRSNIECAITCIRDNSCVGVSTDGNGHCFTHNQCDAVRSCTSKASGHVYMSKECDNGGAWLPSKEKCQCVDGWVGSSCQKHPGSCRELLLNGYRAGNHRLLMNPNNDLTNLIPISCWLPANINMATYIPVMNNRGLTDFNRTWAEYLDGFYNEDDDSKVIWIGLKWWHALSRAGYTKLGVVCFITGVGKVYSQHFDFYVSGEENNFSYTSGRRFKSASVNGHTFGDCFGSNQNTSFMTWDHDGDRDEGDTNCASSRGSGWWYNNCTVPCNLLGWGTPLWDTKPSQELMSVPGIDMDAEKDNAIRTFIYLQAP